MVPNTWRRHQDSYHSVHVSSNKEQEKKNKQNVKNIWWDNDMWLATG